MQTEQQRTRKEENDTTQRREGRPKTAGGTAGIRIQEAGEQGYGFSAQGWQGQQGWGGPPFQGSHSSYGQHQGSPYGQGYQGQQGQSFQGPFQGQQPVGFGSPSMGFGGQGMGFPNPFAAIAPTLSYGLAGLTDLLYRGITLATAQGQALLNVAQSAPFQGRQQTNMVSQQPVWPNARLPPVDIVDEGAELVCQVELPGAKPENVDVACHGRGILVTAHAEPDIDLGALVQAERGLQVTYRRAVQLPVPVNPSGAKARLRDGILTINMPKSDPTEGPRRVPVE